MSPNVADNRFRRWAATLLAHHAAKESGDPTRAREVYQSSTMSALLNGIYDGAVTIAELLTHGDFGLGTFNRLDGELVVLDGTGYHLRADGSATLTTAAERTPFAAVTWFRPDITIPVPTAMDRTHLTGLIDRSITSVNLIYGIRITGTFEAVHTRTVMGQQRPYPPLTEATAGQAETTFTDCDGTLIGFRMPAYEQGVAVAGYHLHFLDAARTSGGHTLDFRLRAGEIAVSTATGLHLSLPTTPQFLQADLSATNLNDQIQRTEGE